MTRISSALAAVVVLALLAPSAASARVLELGASSDRRLAKPSCPENPCLAVTRTTGFQVTSGNTRNPFMVQGTGRVVAFTLNLGKPSATQIDFFNRQAGGAARARIAVLRPVAAETRGTPRYVLNAQSGDFLLQPYFGSTQQFALYTSLLVRKGWIVALSVPTWAPVLAVKDLSNSYAWRASRVAPCSTNPERQPPQVLPGSARNYFCLYRPAQLAYSATIVTAPGAPSTSPNNNSDRNGSGGDEDDNDDS